MVAGWPDLFTAVPLSGAEFDTETGSSASGLVLFFLVLLSLAEHIGFGWAYLIGDVRVHRHDRGYVWLSPPGTVRPPLSSARF